MRNFVTVIVRLLIYSSLFAIMSLRCQAQDVIVKKSGEEINAKVEQISANEIKYRKADNQTGPVYTIPKSEVFMVKYANGARDVFSEEKAPVVTQPQTKSASNVNFTDSEIKPAKTASTISYTLVAPIMLFGTLATVTNGTDASTGFGAGATVIAGIGIPLAAIMAGRVRNFTGAEGNRGLRMAGWIGYGLTLTDAITMLALSESVTFGGGLIMSVAVLGSLSSVCIGMDAGQTYKQAQNMRKGITMAPTIGYVRDFTGKKINTIGIRINF